MKNLNLLTLCLTFVISCGTTESEHKLETTQENKDTFNNNVESYRSLFVDGFKDMLFNLSFILDGSFDEVLFFLTTIYSSFTLLNFFLTKL